jgi:uncharacterized protein YbjT (DUF2867 family)
MKRTAVIAGASGLVGGCCLDALLRREIYERVIALVRRPLGKSHEKLAETQLEAVDELVLPPASDIFCALGTTMRKAGSKAAFRHIDYDYPRRLAERGAACGAAQFLLVSSVGADARSRNFYLRVKGETEHAIAGLPFRTVHIFRPSFLLGARVEPRRGEHIAGAVAEKAGFLLHGRLEKYRAISAEIVGRAMVAAALREERGVCVYEYGMIHWLSRREAAP